MFKRVFYFLIVVSVGALHAEPSAFDAGVIESDNPYGLSESERSILENRKRSLANQKLIRKQALIIEQLQERVEGLSSVVDSLSDKMGQTGQKLQEMGEESQKAGSDDIQKLQAQIDEIKQTTDTQYQKINDTLKKLTKLIAGNSSDISSSKVVHSAKKTPSKPPKKRMTNRQILNKALKLYRAKKYDESQEYWTQLATKNYMPAKTNFYLGEIAYHQKKYDDAISFYKQSVGFYDKASYMPTLLLHTAKSFKNLGEDENAKQFFESLIMSYPDSPEAKIAKKYSN